MSHRHVHFAPEDVQAQGMGDIWDLLAGFVGDISEGRRARIVTETLVNMGLADPRMRLELERNPQAIEQWLSHVDLQALAEYAEPQLESASNIILRHVLVGGGAYVAGLATMHFLTKDK
ncbi:hypothetical protein [Salisaeta icosahedral phage 1]|uniref:hypothetical protein n=1 Tax=Salisaeta icosahedral phage 1 TaxID=1183239 RepID=UPI00025EA931|nr:hypothetical protein A322_gp36 [Salisaeta icosahedral phage 1]AFJ21491.1 hypothetical protein [Salisaeta icosahedral phage 1]